MHARKTDWPHTSRDRSRMEVSCVLAARLRWNPIATALRRSMPRSVHARSRVVTAVRCANIAELASLSTRPEIA